MGAVNAEGDLSFEELCDIVAPIAEKRNIERIYLFGSRARGDNDAESDYDFYVVQGSVMSMTKLCGLMRDLEDALKSSVDVVSEEPYTNEVVLKEVLRDRRLVYGT